jgi:Flp pilus assembly protein TadD
MASSDCPVATLALPDPDQGLLRPEPASIYPNETLLLGAILGVTALLYAGTLRFGFVNDDHSQIVNNVTVQSWHFVPAYFRGQVWDFLYPGMPGNYYRPLNLLLFRLNDALFGLHPAGWHAASVGLHLGVTTLIYRLARRLSGKTRVAAFTALLFAVHPMRHEVVGWVSGSTESLWSLMFLAAFLAYLKARDGRPVLWMVSSCGLYAAALLSKEPAIMLPVIVFAHAWIYQTPESQRTSESAARRWLKAMTPAAVYAPVAIAYLVVRIKVLHGFSHPGNLPTKTFLFTLPSVVLFYVRQWFFPIYLSAYYDIPVWPRFNVVHVLLPVLGFAALLLAAWFWRSSLAQREALFSAAWMFILLLPALDLPNIPELVNDRYFYLPSFGACLLLGFLMEKLAHGPVVFGLSQKWISATLVLLALLCYDTARATRYWADDYLLFQHAYQIAPRNTTVRNNYAKELEFAGDYSQALPMMEGLVRDQPDNWIANYNMGQMLYELQQFPAAQHYVEHARDLAPAMPESYAQLGLIALKTNRVPDAEADMRRAVALRPYEARFHFALGSVLLQQGKCDQAPAEFTEALALKPDLPHAQEQMEKCAKSLPKSDQ